MESKKLEIRSTLLKKNELDLKYMMGPPEWKPWNCLLMVVLRNGIVPI